MVSFSLARRRPPTRRAYQIPLSAEESRSAGFGISLQIPPRNNDRWHSPGKPTGEPPSNLVFVIMSFEEDMDPIFEGIKDAAAAAGLEAKRVKDVIGDYKIDSKLIDMIHQACMVVVDLT